MEKALRIEKSNLYWLISTENFNIYLTKPPILWGHTVIQPKEKVKAWGNLEIDLSATMGSAMKEVSTIIESYFKSEKTTIKI